MDRGSPSRMDRGSPVKPVYPSSGVESKPESGLPLYLREAAPDPLQTEKLLYLVHRMRQMQVGKSHNFKILLQLFYNFKRKLVEVFQLHFCHIFIIEFILIILGKPVSSPLRRQSVTSIFLHIFRVNLSVVYLVSLKYKEKFKYKSK